MALHDNEMYFEACSMNLALKKPLYDENDVTELVISSINANVLLIEDMCKLPSGIKC